MKLQNDLTFSVLGRGRLHFTSLAERTIARLTHLANIAAEGLRHTTVLDRQVRPEAYSPFSFAYAARVIIGLSASPTLLRTAGVTVSPFKFLAQRQDAPFPMIPFGTSVWYPSMHPSKEKPRWSPAVCLGPAQSALFPGLASSKACHDRECYLQDRITGQFLVHGELIVDVLFHRPQIAIRLATHAESAPPEAIADQQDQLMQDFVVDLPDQPVPPSEIPLVTPSSPSTSTTPTPSPEIISPSTPIPAPNPNPTPTSSPDSSPPVPTQLRTVQFDIPDSDLSDSKGPTPIIPPDPPPTFVSPPADDSDSSSSTSSSTTSRRRAQAPRPCFHRPPRPKDDIAVKWHYDDGTSVWLPARVSTLQSRKKPIKDLHGNVLPNDTTYVIEDLSTHERPLYTKQLIEADHGVTWQYALQPHPRSLHRRLQLYSAPSPLYHLAARTAYTALCNTHSTLVLPFVERFRQDLQNSAFFAALLHLDVKLTSSSGSRENHHSPTPTLFASTQDLLECSLLLSFTDSVPLNNQVISPTLYAAVSHATSTSEFKDLGGNAEHLDYLLHHGHVDIAAADDSDFSDLPAHVQVTLHSGIHLARYELLCSADTTQDFRYLGGTQHELEYLLRHDHLLLDSHPAGFLAEVDASTSSLDYAPTVRFARVDEELRKQGFYLHHDAMDTSPTERLFCSMHRQLIRLSLLRLALSQPLRLHNSTRQSSSSRARMLTSMHSRISSGENMTLISTFDLSSTS